MLAVDGARRPAGGGCDEVGVMDDKKLTPQQVEHWRNVLFRMIGPYAFIMPEEDVNSMREKLQADMERITKQELLNRDIAPKPEKKIPGGHHRW